MKILSSALAVGYDSLIKWTDLINAINVFPVADGDTGTNLRISLAPLKNGGGEQVARQLMRCAIGNSGNIAAAFFCCFIRNFPANNLEKAAAKGCKHAHQAVAEPLDGTMLSLFSSLANGLGQGMEGTLLEQQLRQVVLTGPEHLPQLRQAGVVDAGALAMYIFFSAFLQLLDGKKTIQVPVQEHFAGKLHIQADYQPIAGEMYCVDTLLDNGPDARTVVNGLTAMGESLVATAQGERLKIHIHTQNPTTLRSRLTEMGRIIDWSDEKISVQEAHHHGKPVYIEPVHLLLDAAGSLSPVLAAENNITLVANSIVLDNHARAETDCRPEEIYKMLRKGAKVGTAQAAPAGRHRLFEECCNRFPSCLYLCVGSAYTANFAAAVAWKKEHDPQNRLLVIDTGAASGRLGIIGLLTARYAKKTTSIEAVVKAAKQCMAECRELVFINELKYLVRGGRITKSKGFFGDLLRMKPVISPEAEGVSKIGTVRTRREQLDFLHKQLLRLEPKNLLILLEYSDNKTWLQDNVLPMVGTTLPNAEILVVPLSLSSGVHMGPGTWAMAWGYTLDSL